MEIDLPTTKYLGLAGKITNNAQTRKVKEKHARRLFFILERARDGIMEEDDKSMVTRILEAG